MIATPRLCWQPADTPADLHALLRALAEEYPLRAGRPRAGELALAFRRTAVPGTLRVTRDRATARIRYASVPLAARALGCLWAGLVVPGRSYAERTPFRTLGLMPDCSRNAVLTVPHFKAWLRRAALLGYNQAMLYTEDTYELPGEPYFGYLRGAYTEAELRELDAYAAGLGIALVACIQTLGHLAHALRWPAYAKLADGKGGTLLTLEPATYALIEKMIAHWARVFRSRRICVGMDEAVEIGKGRGSGRFGPPRPPADLFFAHVKKVAALCARHGLKPIIWSDLVFWVDTPARPLGEAYYDPAISAAAARRIRARLPRNVELAYWDYSGDPRKPRDPAPYLRRIAKHRAVGAEPIMASGIHVWGRLWHDAPRMTEPRVAGCVAACRRAGVRELLMTIWTGTDGADLDSCWAGLAYTAELAFHRTLSRPRLERQYRAVFGSDYRASAAAALDVWWARPPVTAAGILWDDPLLGIFLRPLGARGRRLLPRLEAHYRRLARRLARWRGDARAGDLDHARRLAAFLGAKAGFAHRLETAYARTSARDLRRVRAEIPALRRALAGLQDSFRAVWLRQFKPFGLEVLQLRLGGQDARWAELDRRLAALERGAIARIEELDVRPLPVSGGRFAAVATGSLLL